MSQAAEYRALAAAIGDGTDPMDPAAFSSALHSVLTVQDRATQEAIRKQLVTAGKNPTASRLDAWASTGGSRDAEAMRMRVMALTKPADYEAARNAAVEAIKVDVNNTFATSLKHFQDAGFSTEEAEKEALKAAQNTKDVQYKALHARFGDDSLFLKGTDYHSKAYAVPR